VRCIQAGADDYILKERLTRLPSAVARAFHNRRIELEREAALERLRFSEERYRLITESTRDVVCLLDLDGAVLYVSPSCHELLGRPPHAMMREPEIWKLDAGGAACGSGILRETLEPANEASVIHCQHANGEWRTFEAVGNWARDAQGAPQHAVVVLRDVTDRKRAEAVAREANHELAASEQSLREAVSYLEKSHQDLRAAQLQLIHAEKMESVGRLAAGVAHEVKNPLTVLMMGIEYLRGRLPASESELQTLLQDMEASARKANDVIAGLLDFSAPGKLARRPAACETLVDNALSLVRHQLHRTQIEIVKDLQSRLPEIECDENKLEQVFVNLFMNSAHAMPHGGTLTIRARPAAAAETPGGDGNSDAWVCFEVEDTGTGLKPEAMTKVFEPFFTTKPAGQGTGLGLAVVKRIVELHGGRVSLRNRDGHGGALAVVLLPRKGTM
jgi:PAS domain S-box-containing protein